jgi:hypothetical protein
MKSLHRYVIKQMGAEMMLKFTYCKNFAHAETREIEWDDFAQRVSTSVGYATKEESVRRAAVVGGLREDEAQGRAENIACRTIASLDYDDLPAGTTLDDVELALTLGLDCAFAAYTTFRHTPEAPRFRVFIPLSRAVSPTEYGSVVDQIRNAIGIEGLDNCSYTVNQIMFLASHKHGVVPWRLTQGGSPWQVPDTIQGQIVQGIARNDADDLDIAVASQPLDISDDSMMTLLEQYPAEGLDYDQWLKVGMAIYHQTQGNGYSTWVAWSAKSAKHDPKHMRVKWRSFGGRSNPITMASIIAAVGGTRAMTVDAASPVAMSLEKEAEQVCDRQTYSAFKKRVQALNETQLSPDIRSLLAKTVHEVYAKEAGMGLREVKSSFKPLKRSSGGETNEIGAPDWLNGWVYAEADCLFVNTDTSDYAIKKEAFRAKYDRMPEVVSLETDASIFALNMVQIPTVVRPMYWPGQPKLFTTEGKDYVNSYHESGVAPCDAIDADGQFVVDLFLKHLENTIAVPREREIVLDFMSYIYRKPDNRVRWGLLLWGIEGNGKTYFYTVLQHLLGRNATLINTSMIERPFNDWAVGARLIGIEEIRISGTNKWKILDQLKPMISNDTIAVEPKGATRYHAPNFASYLMTTNHLDAVPVGDNDRRYCIIFTRHRTQEQLFEQHGGKERAGEYFDKLFSETRRRIDAIGRFLMDRKIGADFMPHGRAPETLGITEMRDANVSDDRRAVEEAIEDHACEIVGSKVLDITYLNEQATMDGKDLPSTRALANILRDKGMAPVDGRRIKIKGAYRYVWFTPASNYTSSDAVKAVRSWYDGDRDFSEVPF